MPSTSDAVSVVETTTCDVSVVILTHDRPPEILLRAVRSVMSQILRPKETVIVDTGGNGPLSREKEKMISTLADGGIRYIFTPGSANGSVGRNLGASMCGCRSIAFLDDDDEWYPDKLRSQLKAMTDGVCIVSSNYHVEDGYGELSLFRAQSALDRVLNNVLSENSVGCTSMALLSRKCFDETGGFDEDMESNQEWDLWMRMLCGGSAVQTPECVGLKHHSATSITTDKKRRRRGWHSIFIKHGREYLGDPTALSEAMGHYYQEMRRHGCRLSALGGLMIHMATDAVASIVEKYQSRR